MGFWEDLNPAQQEAVRHTEGPLIIFAGAGSGKTRVLTYRVAHLLRSGVSPFRILAVTFTNRAAAEMRQRVQQLVGAGARDVWISTFHSLAVRILRQEVRHLPYDRNFVIYDEADQLTVIKNCLRELGLDERKYRPRSMLAAISSLKNELVGPEEFALHARDAWAQAVARLYSCYQAKLLQQNALDFDDLLFQTVALFRAEPHVLENYQHRFRYIMVDEYQDTNHAQYVLVRQLADGYRNLCVVGDDDQCIYRWRGADIRNILDFEKDYPEARIVKLEQNYRSTQRILAVANSVIARNRGRKPKRLWTSNRIGEPVYYYQAVDERDEARFVLATLEKLRREEGLEHRDFAVFYRTHAQSRAFEEEFIRNQIPYRIFGGIRFYERKEIRDLLAYLRFVANPADEISLRRILNVPRRGIGETALARAEELALQEGRSLEEVLREPEKIPGLGARTIRALRAFFEMVDRWREEQEELTVAALAERILEETGYRSLLEAEQTVEAETRLENLKEFLGVAREYDEESEDRSLAGFLERLALVAEIDNYRAEENAVVLMTLHTAKGLEFPVVFMTGLEEGLFPHAHALGEEEELEEERRLCYVGITRARERLFFSWACRRYLQGNGTPREPSRFLQEIPQELLYPVLPGGGAPVRPVPVQGRPARDRREKLPPVFTGRALLEAAERDVEPQGDLQVGDRVEHAKFGPGVVTETRVGPGGDLEIIVSFEQVGVKHLLVKYAPLRRV
ncbi:MAG: DNA helicase PcrA [Firmicutes bacterium]|nr:DNA helicase PcrA [Bacillota bacterium]